MSHSTHSFSVTLAAKIGLNDALILQHFYFWHQRNAKNNKNFIDGSYWTYNRIESFRELFPYLTKNQITGAISRLEKKGYTRSANHNEHKYDRTKWYCLTEKGILLFEQSETISENQKCNSGNQNSISGKQNTIPDSNTDSKPEKEERAEPKIHAAEQPAAPAPSPSFQSSATEVPNFNNNLQPLKEKSETQKGFAARGGVPADRLGEAGVKTRKDLSEAEQAERRRGFRHWWNLYDYDKGKNAAWEIFRDPVQLKLKDLQALVRATPAYVKSTPDKQFRKTPVNFLKERIWEDEILKPQPKKAVEPDGAYTPKWKYTPENLYGPQYVIDMQKKLEREEQERKNNLNK